MHEPTAAFTIDDGHGPVTARSFEALRQRLCRIASGGDDAFVVIGREEQGLPQATFCQAYFDGEGNWDVTHKPGHSGRHYHLETTAAGMVFHVMCQWLDGSPGFFGHDWSQTAADEPVPVNQV